MKFYKLCSLVLFSLLVLSCSEPDALVSISLWHTFGGGMRPVIEKMVDDFNETAGRQKGITVNIEAVTEARITDDMLLLAVNHEPGAPELPDISFARSYMVPLLVDNGLLADLSSYFTGEELDAYVPEYLAEGTYDGRNYLLPVVKGCEVMYVNATLFDRFADGWYRRTGERFTLEDLSDVERVVDIGRKYHQYTDDLTPGVSGDGKAIYAPETFLPFFYTFVAQQGADLFDTKNDTFNLSTEQFGAVYRLSLFAVLGGITPPISSYGTYHLISGEVLMATTSSGEGMYIQDRVFFPDNTYEDCRFRVLPLPAFSGGKKVANRRGVGMGIFKSTSAREKAAAVFLKWLTAPEQNLRICAESGYLPVMKEGRTESTLADISFKRPLLKEAFTTALREEKDYVMYRPPPLKNYVELRKMFDDETTRLALSALEEQAEGKTVDVEAALRTMRASFAPVKEAAR